MKLIAGKDPTAEYHDLGNVPEEHGSSDICNAQQLAQSSSCLHDPRTLLIHFKLPQSCVDDRVRIIKGEQYRSILY